MEGVDMAWDVLAAQHGAEWLQTQQLPLRYALLQPAPPRGCSCGGGEAAAGGPAGCGCVEVRLWEIWPDDGASWPGLQALAQLTHEIHARLGISSREQEACLRRHPCPCPHTRVRRLRPRLHHHISPHVATPSPPHRHTMIAGEHRTAGSLRGARLPSPCPRRCAFRRARRRARRHTRCCARRRARRRASALACC